MRGKNTLLFAIKDTLHKSVQLYRLWNP